MIRQLIYRSKDKQPVPSSRYTGSPHYKPHVFLRSSAACDHYLSFLHPQIQWNQNQASTMLQKLDSRLIMRSRKQRLAYELVTGYVFVNCQIGHPACKTWEQMNICSIRKDEITKANTILMLMQRYCSCKIELKYGIIEHRHQYSTATTFFFSKNI